MISRPPPLVAVRRFWQRAGEATPSLTASGRGVRAVVRAKPAARCASRVGGLSLIRKRLSLRFLCAAWEVFLSEKKKRRRGGAAAAASREHLVFFPNLMLVFEA